MKDDINANIKGQKTTSSSGKPESRTTKKKPNATSIHSTTQRSHTLYRRAVKKPTIRNKALTRNAGRSMDIARSNNVSHFAKQSIISPAPISAKEAIHKDIKPVSHPMATKVHKIRAAKVELAKPKPEKSSKEIKNEAIAEALSKPAITPKKKNIFQRHPKLFNAFTFGVIFIFIAGYLTYLNMPSLSVKIANAQAGIDATFPEYHPDGYSLSGPITYSDGEITINFHGNTGSSKFVIKQSKSSWDSSAVKNKVDKESKGQFITTEEKGLTIYTYNGNAAWVNGGILYTIDGNAPLSGDQIRRIATSL